MSLHISNVPIPSSSLGVEDQYPLSQELASSGNASRDDQAQGAVQEIRDAKSDDTDVQKPNEPDLVSEEQLRSLTRPLVTIFPREMALLNSQTGGRLQPHLPPHEWSFWTDACLRGPKPFKLQGCGLGIVYRRLENSKPSDRDFAITWWQSCFVARNIYQIGHAEMLAVAQALEMAVDQCERIAGVVVTKARIKVPGAAEEIKRRASGIPWPMPKVVNVFTTSQRVLDSLDSCWLFGRSPGRRSPMRHANVMIEALGGLGVTVHLQWVPGHAIDLRNRWAYEGARNALKPQFRGQRVYTRKVHRVHWTASKDRTVTRPPSTVTIEKRT